MKRSLTENRSLSFDQLMRLYLYPVYEDILEYMVDDDERIHFKGNTWVVILDHSTGGFYFSGELHKYYSIDTIQAIRDAYGDIYSIFNMKYDEVPRNTWIKIEYEVEEEEKVDGRTSYERQYSDEEKKREMLRRKKEYYWMHKEEINKRQREYYKKRKRS